MEEKVKIFYLMNIVFILIGLFLITVGSRGIEGTLLLLAGGANIVYHISENSGL